MERLQKYEVIRMSERDGESIISMDYAEGTLLIYRVQEKRKETREEVLRWIRQITEQVWLYQKHYAGKNYRCLNPYSVLITRDGKALLLDMEAESNAFVIRNMQKRALRTHFARTAPGMDKMQAANGDLQSLGRMIQFLLACIELRPSFYLTDELRLVRCVRKCLGETPQKAYGNPGELLAELPRERKPRTSEQKYRWKLVFCSLLLLTVAGIGKNVLTGEATEKSAPVSKESLNGKVTERCGSVIEEKRQIALGESEEQSNEMQKVRAAFLKNTDEGNQIVIEEGEKLRSELLYYLSRAYDREDEQEKAIELYSLLSERDCEESLLEEAFFRKARLEQEADEIEKAKETCRKGIEKCPDSERLQNLEDKLSEQ